MNNATVTSSRVEQGGGTRVGGNYMELIYPEFLRFKDRVAVPYTAYTPLAQRTRARGYGPRYAGSIPVWGTFMGLK